MNLSRLDRIYGYVDVTATLADGAPATVAGVEGALLAPRATPKATTVWSAATYTDGTARFLLAGPDATPTDALPVPAAGADLWIRVVDNPEVQAVRVDRITVY